MTTKCASFVRGRVLRATRLDSCGRPVIGDDSVVISNGWTSVAYTANTDEGTEISVPNAANQTIVYEPAQPKFLGYTVEISFAKVDPDVFALLTGQRTIVDDIGDVIGFTMDTSISSADTNFSLEVWAGSPGGASCDNPTAGASYGYFLLPFLQGGWSATSASRTQRSLSPCRVPQHLMATDGVGASSMRSATRLVTQPCLLTR